jgi:hypothetical protein
MKIAANAATKTHVRLGSDLFGGGVEVAELDEDKAIWLLLSFFILRPRRASNSFPSLIGACFA